MAPLPRRSVSYEAGRNLARAVLIRAFRDATAHIPEWSDTPEAKEDRAEREDARAFLLSDDPKVAELRRLWYRLAERPEPTREKVNEILERYAAQVAAEEVR